MRMFLTCLLGAVGLLIVDFGPPATAQSLKSVVGTLNAIVNPRMRGGSKIRRGAIGGGMMNVIGAITVKDSSSSGASEAAQSLSTAARGGIRDKSIRMRLNAYRIRLGASAGPRRSNIGAGIAKASTSDNASPVNQG